MILTSLTQKEQITIPRSIMKKLDIIAGSEVSIEVSEGTVVIRKLPLPPKVESDKSSGKTVNYFANARRRPPSTHPFINCYWGDKI